LTVRVMCRPRCPGRSSGSATTRLPPEETTWAVARMLATRGQIPVSGLLRLAGINFGAAAAEHLFSVMSGLEPMAMGEGQIAARVKAA
jgi:glutamyl-tRNA reductase